jgi:hypothetical protein
VRYREFEFKNFKGIEAMSLKLTGPVTTMIGLNESGKTTILEAIFCFSYGAEDLQVINPEMASLRMPEQWIPISKRGNFNDTIEFRAFVELSDEDHHLLESHMLETHGLKVVDLPTVIEIAEIHHFENSRFVRTKYVWDFFLHGTTGQQRKPREFRAKDREWHSAVDFLITLLPRIWYFPNFLFELPERFALVEDDEVADDADQDRSRFYRSTFEQILTQLGEGANLQTHVVDRLSSSERADQRSLDAVLLDMGRLVTKTIFDGWDRIFGRRPAAQEVQLEARQADGKSFIELRIKGSDGYYDLSERSLGFRWFFMFLLMTSFHGLKDEDSPKSLFLLDEPASNLHSTAQAELLKSFQVLIDRCELVYTTHSHHLIDVRWLDSAYIVKNAALESLDMDDLVNLRIGSHTSISATPYRQFVAQHPDQTSYFQPVLDLLDYRPSVVEPVPDVVLVEGKGDFYLLRYVTEILHLHSDIRLVPGGGAGSLGALIRLHVGWGKSFVVLLDGDKEGVRQKERYEEELGPVFDGRCFLLPDLCSDPGVLEAEDLLEKEDRDALTSAIFGTDKATPRPKKALHQAILELYAGRQSVELAQASQERITLLLSQLATQLGAQDAN